MLSWHTDEREQLLLNIIPNRLSQEGENKVRTYMILAPASRPTLKGLINSSFATMEGLFPSDLSDQVAADRVEPYLLSLDQDTLDLLCSALEERNGVIILYSSLDLLTLVNQLKPLVEVSNGETGQLEYLMWWEASIFPTLASVMDKKRQAAFMGNIHAIGLMQPEFPNQLHLHYVGEDGKMWFRRLEPNNVPATIPHQLMKHCPFSGLMPFTRDDQLAFKNARVDQQIRQMTHLLAGTEQAQTNGHHAKALEDDVIQWARHGYFRYGLTQTQSLYAFVKASYWLGAGFEEKSRSLLSTLADQKESNSIKQVRIERHLAAHGYPQS